MNPENRGEQIVLRHSSLWRNPMFLEKRVEDVASCHKQLNQLGQTGQSWRTRNNLIKTNYFNPRKTLSMRKSRQSVEVNELLAEDKNSSNLTRSMLRSFKPDSDTLERSQQLIEGMKKLREMDLLAGKEMQKVKFPGIIRHEHVHNDYHVRETNPGFSRNYMGKFYTK